MGRKSSILVEVYPSMGRGIPRNPLVDDGIFFTKPSKNEIIYDSS